MMRTLAQGLTADGIALRLEERDTKPRYVITVQRHSLSGWVYRGDDRFDAETQFEHCIRKINQ